MKPTRETRRVKEEGQGTAAQTKKMVKVDEPSRPNQRSAFGDLTNAVPKNGANGKKEVGKKVRAPVEAKAKVTLPKPRMTTTSAQAQAQPKKTKKPATQTVVSKVKAAAEKAGKKITVAVEEEEEEVQVILSQETVTSSCEDVAIISSGESVTSSQETLPFSDPDPDMAPSDIDLSLDKDHSIMSLDCSKSEDSEDDNGMPKVPVDQGVEDMDSADLNDPSLAALYAHDIFIYYKAREEQFKLSPYMARQPQVSQRMRAVLVDWLVEVQENFELNHETLYLAVKLVDTYMSIVDDVSRDNVQLLGAVALFLSSKYDERMPPAIDDFIYICDHAYNRDQFMAMERELFRTVGFDLGRPISYRFLRRYARCGRSEVKTLYLARYLLELSLMEYKLIFQRESMLAAACLYIAKQMRDEGGWTPTLHFYTGYQLKELKPLILELNTMVCSKRFSDLVTIRDKYKHHLFHSVAEIAAVGNEDLFKTDRDMNDSH